MGEVIAPHGVCRMPPWLAALAVQQLHVQFVGEELLYPYEARTLFGPKKTTALLKLTKLGRDKLGLTGALVLPEAASEFEDPKELFHPAALD